MLNIDDSKSLENFLKLYSVKGVGFKFLKSFYETFGTFGGDFYGNLKTFLTKEKFEKLKREMESKGTAARFSLTLKRCKELDCSIVPFWSKEYPKSILELSKNPPPLLFVVGEPTEGFAIVGTRKANNSGIKKAEEFARTLAEKGITVISGGAEGIDWAAHRGALSVNGKTGVILGEGLDIAFKRKGKFLKEVISKGGFLLSQFPIGFIGTKWSFPKRNETIAALSTLGCLVVEAPSKSGSLITAEYCKRFGRKVFTYIGLGEHPNYRGCIELLKTSAEFVANGEELIKLLNEPKKGAILSRKEEANREQNLANPILKFLSDGVKSFDELIALSGLNPAELMEMLTELQLEGKVGEEGGFYYLS
jgi:DNA processing protein